MLARTRPAVVAIQVEPLSLVGDVQQVLSIGGHTDEKRLSVGFDDRLGLPNPGDCVDVVLFVAVGIAMKVTLLAVVTPGDGPAQASWYVPVALLGPLPVTRSPVVRQRERI